MAYFSHWPLYRPSNHWERSPAPSLAPSSLPDSPSSPQLYTRQLGGLELKFDQSSAKNGSNDTFVRLSISLPSTDDEEQQAEGFLARLTLAWASVRAKHPLLGSTVHNSTSSTFYGVQHREFRYLPPSSAQEAVEQARRTLLVHDAGEKGLEVAMEEVQRRWVLNGERVLLKQDECMARLVLLKGGKGGEKVEMGFFLVISHVISDGLSVFKLVSELFTIATSLSLPTPPLPPSCYALPDHLLHTDKLPSWELPPGVLAAWEVLLPNDTLLSRLPLANEDHYPTLPPPNPSPSSHNPPPSPSLPRQRWYWAIHRTILIHRFSRFPKTLHLPRLQGPTPPVQARTRWERMQLSRETSGRLLRLCKREGISPSMLLYSLISLSLSNLLAAAHPDEPYHPVVIGFPFSVRPFLLPIISSSPLPPPHSDPSSDLAIRITFSQIQLPFLPFPLPFPLSSSANVDAAQRVKAAALRGAKLAKQQFAQKLSAETRTRGLFHAEAHSLVLQRLLNGVGNNPIKVEEPRTCLNASMIGDVSRILPVSFPYPSPTSPSSPSTSSTLRLSSLHIGTRLHNGEGLLLEALTWDGLITLCLGIDDGLIREETARGVLKGVTEVGEVLAGLEEE